MAGLRDHERRSRAEDLARFAQDHLEPARIGVARELSRVVGGRDAGEVDDTTLDLRDRLLGHDENVLVLESTRTRRSFGEHSREIVSFLELRDPQQRDDAQLSGQLRPVTRIPA